MKRQTVWVVVNCLMVLALLVTSCTKAEEEAPAPAAKEAAPVVKEVAPVPKETAPAVAENMVKVKLTKNDGTVVEKLVEKPKYGGVRNEALSTIYGWDEANVPPFRGQGQISLITDKLIQGDWTRGPIGTNEYDWGSGGYWSNPAFTIGNLAESWEFPDNTTMIFHIRKGVKWQNKPPVNGREFTADDAVFNIKRMFFEIKTSTTYAQAGVARPTDVYATDKYTVVVKNAPQMRGMTWEYVGANLQMVPPEVVQKYGDMKQWENVVGTGPFILSDYVAMGVATYTRNPNYYMNDALFPENQLPYLDGVKQFIIPDASTRLAALRTGKVDTMTLVTEDALPMIKGNPNLLYVGQIKRSTNNLFGFRVDKPELPFDDIRVRRAMWMGFNNQEILDTYYGGKGAILTYKVAPVPGMMEAYTPLAELPPAADGFDNKKLYGYYPEEARKLLAEAGYPQGFTTEVVINSATTEHIDLATMLAAAWAKIGITLKLDVKEAGAYLAIYNAQSHKEGLVEPRYNDQQYAMRSLLTKNAHNWAMVSDPYLDQTYVELTDLFFDVPKRLALMKEVNKYIVSQAYYVVPPLPWNYRFWQPWVKGYHGEVNLGPNSSGRVWRHIWIDQELKKSMGY